MSSNLFQPGARVGKYQVEAHIATGGMGTVYRAVDVELRRTVALKVLTVDVAAKPTAVERFRREARHAARLSHKNIVTLYGLEQAGDTLFLVMEYIRGIDLEAYITRKGRLEPEESRRILIQAVKALDHAYKQDIIHRDIKPANFLLTRENGRMLVKLTDLGLAQRADEQDFRVTRAGSTVGTVDYLSPEQARDSASADVRSDIYSLGCTLYHMLTGNPPFAEGGLGERIYKHLEAEPPDPRTINPAISRELWLLLRRMLAKKPQERYQTPAELLDDLKRIRTEASDEDETPEPSTPPPAAPAAADSPPPAPPPAIVDYGPSNVTRERLRVDSTLTEQLGLSEDHLQIAARQYERVGEVIASGNTEYALQLLLTCCKLDPLTLIYRQTLRQVGKSLAGGRSRGWRAALSGLATRTRLVAARRTSNYRKMLEYGEEILARNPEDVATQVDLADAAEHLGQADLAIWMLEEARTHAPENPTVLRPLARLYEEQRRYSEAIDLWEKVRKIDPADGEAFRKIHDLAARDTIRRGGYKK